MENAHSRSKRQSVPEKINLEHNAYREAIAESRAFGLGAVANGRCEATVSGFDRVQGRTAAQTLLKVQRKPS